MATLGTLHSPACVPSTRRERNRASHSLWLLPRAQTLSWLPVPLTLAHLPSTLHPFLHLPFPTLGGPSLSVLPLDQCLKIPPLFYPVFSKQLPTRPTLLPNEPLSRPARATAIHVLTQEPSMGFLSRVEGRLCVLPQLAVPTCCECYSQNVLKLKLTSLCPELPSPATIFKSRACTFYPTLKIIGTDQIFSTERDH